MTLGIDASRSITTIQKTGVELVSDELLKTINNQKSAIGNLEIVYYTPSKIDWLPRENQRILRWPFKFFWTQVRLAWELIFHPPTAMFFPVHALPLILICAGIGRNRAMPCSYQTDPVPTKFFHVIHDIAFKKQPQLYSLKQKLILNLDLFLTNKLCTKIFVPTEAVRQDLIQYTQINRDKIVVTPWGYHTKEQKHKSTETQRKKQILYIGRVEEKKNITNLIKAFEIFQATHPDYKLVLAGKVDFKFPNHNFQPACRTGRFPNKSQITNSKNKNHNTSYIIHNTIEFLGYISEDKKQQLLRESAALVLVSKEEGFGFPILEAFDFGLPVVASDIPVLREICGEACLYADPDSPSGIADKLEQIITDQNFSSQLTTVGREHLAQFSWPKTTEKILGEILGE